MAAFVVFDQSTGAIKGSYTISHADQLDVLMSANTRSGMDALAAPLDHEVLNNQGGWQVINGALQPVTPTAAQLLATAQSTQTALLMSAFQSAIAAPVSYMSTTFLADPESQMILAHALTIYNQAGATPSGFYFLDANNNEVVMTLPQLQGLGQAVSAQYLTAFQRRVTLQKQIAAATTIADVQALVWS